jgi:tetratricopeptide (TPR) repeat protein
MAEKHKPLNPYIAGSALADPQGFFGREDILRLVEAELRSPYQNAVVLSGQRRIGKTSILLQLHRRLAESGFVPVYLDLMNRAYRPLGTVLGELAERVAGELGLDPLPVERFDDDGRAFRHEFLPLAYAALDQGATPASSSVEPRRLVFLFDEFDVLDAAATEELPITAAARAFFPYLRELMAHEKRLGFVIVVGRKMEELSTDFRAAFRGARHQRVSVLAREDATALILLAEQDPPLLHYTDAAVDRILALTAGHPYFTQLLCFVLFGRAWAAVLRKDLAGLSNLPGVREVDQADVDAVVPQVLEAGNNAFQWLWDGLPEAERIIFSAIATGTEEGQVFSEDQIVQALQQHGIRLLIRELELAPRTLVEWEMLCRVEGGYRFFIELIRRWVVQNWPLARVEEDLERGDVVASGYFGLGKALYRRGKLDEAIERLREAVTADPNHLGARLLLGTCLRERGLRPDFLEEQAEACLAEAIKEFEWAYEYDAQAARYELVRTLLLLGERQEKRGAEDDALAAYGRVLAVSPRERQAAERRAAIYVRRGDAALAEGRYDDALAAYQSAGAQDKLAEAQARKRQADLEAFAKQGEEAADAENWDTAVQVYERLAGQDPDEPRWRDALDWVRREQRLKERYTAGLGAVKQQQWEQAKRALADVLYEKPEYKEASRYLHLAVAGQDAAKLQADLEQERAQRQELAQRLKEVPAFPLKYLPVAGWVAVALLVVVLFGVGAVVGRQVIPWATPAPTLPPTVLSIESPPNYSEVISGTVVQVIARIQAREGVDRVILVADGKWVTYTVLPPADQGSVVPISLYWPARGLGEHTLRVDAVTATWVLLGSSSTVVKVVQPTPEPATATPQLPVAWPPPTLESPQANVELQGVVTFTWDYPIQLGEGEVFQVMICQQGWEGQCPAAAAPTRALEQIIDLDGVPQVKANGPGTYFWTVVLVRSSTGERLSEEANPWRFVYVGLK